jgi:hypothetical protein
VVAATALACAGDRATSPAPETSFDASRTLGDLDVMGAALRHSTWQSLATMGPRFNLSPLASGVVSTAGDLASADPRQAAVGTAQRLLTLAGSWRSGSAAANGTIPPAALGRTFVFDAAQHKYLPDPTRAGAPPNGVRFILYAVNPVTHEPVTAAEVGYADLMDEAAPGTSGLALHLVVVSGATIFLDYRVAMDGSPTTGVLSVSGFVVNGESPLHFQIAAHGTSNSDGAAIDVEFQFAVPERGFSVEGRVHGVHAATSGGHAESVHLRVATGSAAIGFDAQSDGENVDATISVNGHLFATVRGDGRNPEIRGEGGRPLSTDELQALGQIVQFAGGALATFGQLLAPVEGIVGLSHVL